MAMAAAAESGVDGCGVSNTLSMRQVKGPVRRFSDNWIKARKDEARFDGIGARGAGCHVCYSVILSRTAERRLKAIEVIIRF